MVVNKKIFCWWFPNLSLGFIPSILVWYWISVLTCWSSHNSWKMAYIFLRPWSGLPVITTLASLKQFTKAVFTGLIVSALTNTRSGWLASSSQRSIHECKHYLIADKYYTLQNRIRLFDLVFRFCSLFMANFRTVSFNNRNINCLIMC